MEKSEVLQGIALFSSLPEEILLKLTEQSEVKTIQKYDYIYMHDELANNIFFLLEGTIKIGNHSSDGREIIKRIVYPKDVFGELALVGEVKRSNFARAMKGEVTYAKIPLNILRKLMLNNIQLSTGVIDLVGKRLMATERKLEALIFDNARDRIIDFLRTTAQNHGRKVGFEMLLKHSLTQQDIANFTGTSRQTVTSVLNDLKKQNLIHFSRNKILIRDMDNLS